MTTVRTIFEIYLVHMNRVHIGMVNDRLPPAMSVLPYITSCYWTVVRRETGWGGTQGSSLSKFVFPEECFPTLRTLGRE